jgi:hypothetical protein
MTNDIASELALLHTLKGSAYVNQLKTIAGRKEFHPLEEDPCIFTVGGENGEDYPFLLNAARKAVEHGYQVYILPILVASGLPISSLFEKDYTVFMTLKQYLARIL